MVQKVDFSKFLEFLSTIMLKDVTSRASVKNFLCPECDNTSVFDGGSCSVFAQSENATFFEYF